MPNQLSSVIHLPKSADGIIAPLRATTFHIFLILTATAQEQVVFTSRCSEK